MESSFKERLIIGKLLTALVTLLVTIVAYGLAGRLQQSLTGFRISIQVE